MDSDVDLSVCMISTPDVPECGVGTYTGDLISSLGDQILVSHVMLKVDSTNPLHFLNAAIKAGRTDSELIHVQHEYGLFGPKSIMAWVFFPVLYLLKTLRDRTLVITVHEAWSRGTISTGPHWIKFFYIMLMNSLIQVVADELIFLSEPVREEFDSPISNEVSQLIPHGVMTDQLFSASTEIAKAEFGYGSEDTVIVEPGYVSKEKGSDAFCSIADRFSDMKFLLAGGTRVGDLATVIGEKATKTDNLRITGVLNDERFHLALLAADVIVLPYRKDGQSGVFNLCAAYQVPVVGSRCKYFQGLSQKYDCIELFTLDELDSIETAINKVLYDEERREQLKSNLGKFKEEESLHQVSCMHINMYCEDLVDND